MNEKEFKNGEFESNFGPQFKPLPNNPRTVEEYEEKANPDLKAHNRRIVKNDYYQLMKSALIGLGIFCGVLLYLIYNGYINDEVIIPACPNFSCPDIPENVACPEMNCPIIPPCPICHNICNVEFPSELNVNVTE